MRGRENLVRRAARHSVGRGGARWLFEDFWAKRGVTSVRVSRFQLGSKMVAAVSSLKSPLAMRWNFATRSSSLSGSSACPGDSHLSPVQPGLLTMRAAEPRHAPFISSCR